MPEILDHVAYLSQRIGPRPAGTEEEQQAALYIIEQLQKEAGLSALIEDFNGGANADAARAICCGLTFVIALLALFFPMLGVSVIIISLITAFLFAAEVFERPIISRVFARGVSQNVVAKYEPGYTAEGGGTRRRKIVLVARYDSGKVRPELRAPYITALPLAKWATFGAMVLIPVLFIVRTVLFSSAEGALAIVFNVLIGIALFFVALPLIVAIMHKAATYNEAANSNAAGIAVLLDVARRVAHGRTGGSELPSCGVGVTIHGEEAARASGLIPEGAQLSYDAARVQPPALAPQSSEARLAAAKAAVAALSGKSVSGWESSDIASNLVQVKEPPLPSPTDADYQTLRGETREAFTTIPAETVRAAVANAEANAEASAEAAPPQEAARGDARTATSVGTDLAAAEEAGQAGSSRVPDWFKKAQEKAKRPKLSKKPVQRSRYADALDAAMSESSDHFDEANTAVASEMEGRLQSMRDGIMEVKAPHAERRPDDEAPARSSTWGPAPTTESPSEGSGGPVDSSSGVVGGTVAGGETPVVVDSSGIPAAHPSVGEGPTGEPSAEEKLSDPEATRAMSPIDVADLRLDDIPPIGDVPLPAFLDPRKAQVEKLEERGDVHRTSNRIDVTDAAIGDSGRIEYTPPHDDEFSDSPPARPVDSGVRGTADTRGAAGTEDSAAGRRRPIVLPDIGVSATNLTPHTDAQKQRAPLADAETSGKSAAKSLLTMLPSIDPAAPGPHEDTAAASGSSEDNQPKAELRSSLPSLSGSITQADDATTPVSTVGSAGVFAPAGATGAFAPVGDELLDNVDPDDIYIDDADDSAYDESLTQTGAFAGPGYVEMPKSRAHRLFDKLRFRKPKHKEHEATPQEWLDVDGTFDARSVGEARGGWESFRSEDAEGDIYHEETFVEDTFAGPADEPSDSYLPESDDAFETGGIDDYEEDEFRSDVRGRWEGGAFSRLRVDRTDTGAYEDVDVDEPVFAHPEDSGVSSELQQIYQFRNPDITTDVWFVALGSELTQQGGMNAFLTDHNQDMRGAIIIELDSLGAGSLSMIDREGEYRKAKTSSRMNRYIRKVSQATGLPVDHAAILWGDSAASVAIKQGFQAMHLVGMEGGKPAFFAQEDDVFENVDEEILRDNADFVMELLKNI